jgi:hypothetical protein
MSSNADLAGLDRGEPVWEPRGLLRSISASPPTEVLESLGVAVATLEELAARGIGIRLDVAAGRSDVRVRVTHGCGRSREIPALVALEVISGGRADGLLAGAVA